MHTKTCTNCGETKAFDASEWRTSRGLPTGKLCKKCIALKQRAARTGSGDLILNVSHITDAQIARIGKCLTLLSGLSAGAREPIDQIEDRFVTELRYSSLNAVCTKYLREILDTN